MSTKLLKRSSEPMVSGTDHLKQWNWPDKGMKVCFDDSQGKLFGFLTTDGTFWKRTIPLSKDMLGTEFEDAAAANDYFQARYPKLGWKYDFFPFIWKPVIIFLENPTYQLQVIVYAPNQKTVTIQVAHYDTVHGIKHRLLSLGYRVCKLYLNTKLLPENVYIGETDIPSTRSNVYAEYYNGGIIDEETCRKCIQFCSNKRVR